MDVQLPQMLRADAEDNRERVLEAARELFAERGLDVPLREVARRAGVGPATLYRRFPTKQSLVDAAFTGELQACRAIVEDGCADADAWRGFSSVVMRLGELNSRNQGFTDAFMSAHPAAGDFRAHREDLLRMLSGLSRRAQADGSLRADFVLDDLVLVLMAGRGLAASTAQAQLGAARRFSALALEAFRASSAQAQLPPPARVAALASDI